MNERALICFAGLTANGILGTRLLWPAHKVGEADQRKQEAQS